MTTQTTNPRYWFLFLLLGLSFVDAVDKKAVLSSSASPSSTLSSKVAAARDEIYIDDEGIEGSGGRGELHDDLEKDPDYSGSGFGPDDEDSSTDQRSQRPSIHTQSGNSKQNTNDNDLIISRTHQTNSGTIIGSGTSSNSGIISGTGGSGNTALNTVGKDHTSLSASSSSSATPTEHTNTTTTTTTSSLYPYQTSISPSHSHPHPHPHPHTPVHTDDDDFDLDETIDSGSGDGHGNSDVDDDDDDDDHTGDVYEDNSDAGKINEGERVAPKEDTSHSDVDDDYPTEMYIDSTETNSSTGGIDGSDSANQRPGINNQGTTHELDTNNINSLPPDTKVVEHTTGNEVLIMNAGDDDRTTSFFAQPGILAAVIGGAVVGLLCAILVVMFIVYRMRKKDEGSYALDEPKRSPAVNSYAKNANNREFYA